MDWQGWMEKIKEAVTSFDATKVVGRATKTVQDKADDYIAKKRSEFVSHARTEAERFIVEQLALIEEKVDLKIAEVEQKIDAQIEKEVRSKLRILIYTLVAVILMSLISLAYLYSKKYLGL
jgi:tetrahydromethanopterin S-methyltransferase subunit G